MFVRALNVYDKKIGFERSSHSLIKNLDGEIEISQKIQKIISELENLDEEYMFFFFNVTVNFTENHIR